MTRHQYQDAYQQSLTNFKQQSPHKMADLSLAQYKDNYFTLPYIGESVTIDYPTGEITSKFRPLTLEDKIIILQYLAETTPAIKKNNWISFLQLPGGPLHHDPFVKVAQGTFERRFARNKTELFERSQLFGAQVAKISTESLIFNCLPKIPLVVQFWEADDEFPAKCNILFDASAPQHLQTATLFMLGLRLAFIVAGTAKE